MLAALWLAGCSGSKAGPHPDGATSSRCLSEADCGGATPYCEPSTGTCVQCRFSAECPNEVCETNACRPAKSCTELHTELPGLATGVYTIDPGTGAFDAQCEMSTDRGGWTLVQRTVWSWAASMPLQTDYATWYGQTIGTPGSGGYRLAGSRWPKVGSAEILVVHRVRTTAGGACQPLYYKGYAGFVFDDAMASLTDFSGSAALVDAATLSTTDQGPGQTCVTADAGVPWFYGSCCSTCPTFGGGYWSDEPHPMQDYTQTTADLFGKTEAQACQGAAVRTADNASTYRGDDAMEVYLR